MIRRLAGLLFVGAGLALWALVGLAWSRTRLATPDASVMLLDHDGRYLGEVGVPHDGRLGFWPPDAGPRRLMHATLAIEDHRFFEHAGLDVRAVGRALHGNLVAGRRISGASTIAMQVARMQDPGPRTWPRKLVEATTALFLVERFGHDAVLAHYLTLAPYGHNVHGGRYAARRFFDKPLADLTWAEASLLAGLPQAPGRMDPYTPVGRRRAVERARRVLGELHRHGSIDDDALAVATEELAHLRPLARRHRPASTLHAVLALDGVAKDQPERRTTLDLPLQDALDAIAATHVARWRDRGAEQAAIVVADRRSLAVRAAIGSIGFDGTLGGAIDYTRTPRTPGSTLKPFVYALALDEGVLTPNTVLDDLQQGVGGIRNADQDFLGPLLPRQALANSRNVPAVGLAEQLGLDRIHGRLRMLGLHDGARAPDHYGYGLVLGGMPVRLVDLVAAYGTLGNDGLLRPLRWLEDTPETTGRQVFTPAAARLVATWLADPTARSPTFPRGGAFEPGFPVAAKTGTSPDHRDSWAVALTDDHLVGVWVGHPDWRPMRGLTGYRAAGTILGEVLHALAEHEPPGASDGFPPPADWTSHTVCALTGDLATPLCDTPRDELFPPDAVPTHRCTGHRAEDGRVVVDLPPRYQAWLTRQGIPTAHPPLDRHAPVALDVLSPRPGTSVMADPDVAAAHSTLRLAAAVDPPVEQVVWFVDGEPFQTVGPPYVARWPVRPGTHTFEVRSAVGPERSARVAVHAR